MYEITAITYVGEKETRYVLSRALMENYVRAFRSCEDVEKVEVIDGLTGEILFTF